MHSRFFITVLFVFYVAERRNNTLAWTYVKTAFLMVSFIRWFIVHILSDSGHLFSVALHGKTENVFYKEAFT
jgi:hypothetical protein